MAATEHGDGAERLIARYRVSEKALYCVAWSPDGALLALGGEDNKVRVLSPNGEERLCCSGHDNWVDCLAFSGDGGRIASGSGDQTIRLWDAKSAAELACLTGHGGGVSGVAFSPDGQRIASASWDKTIRLWDAGTGVGTAVLREHQDYVLCMVATPDFRRLASGSGDNTVRLWDTETKTECVCCIGHKGWVESVAISPDGSQLASASIDQTIRLWDSASGAEMACLVGHDSDVLAVVFSAAGQHLASGGVDNTVRLWDANTKTEIACLAKHEDMVRSLAFSPDGRRLASVSHDGTLCLWDTADLARLPAIMPHTDGPFFLWLCRQAATLGRAPIAVPAAAPDLWVPDLPGADDTGLLGVLRPENLGGYASKVALGPDGRRLYRGTTDGRIQAIDLCTGELLWSVRHHSDNVCDIRLSPDGRRLASGSDDKTICIVDCASGDELVRLVGHDDRVNSVAFHPDGRRLASGADDKTIRLWDTQTGTALACLTGHGDWVRCVAFAPDGHRLASGSQDGTTRLWDVASASEIASLASGQGTIYSVAYAPDGRSVASATANGAIRLSMVTAMSAMVADAETRRFAGHTDAVNCIAFSPDGQRLASGGRGTDKTIRLWDTASGSEIQRWTFPEGYCWRLAWAASGAFLVAGLQGDTTRIVDTRTPAMLAASASAGFAPATPAASQGAPCPAAWIKLTDYHITLHRLGIAVPLSLLADLYALLAGQAPESLQALAAHLGLRKLCALRWPERARTGLVALLLHAWPGAVEWQAPPPISSENLRAALTAALASGKPIPPTPPAPPVAWLAQALTRIDARLLTLLSALGPQAVAADPGLPLRLLPQVALLPPLSIAQRQLLARNLTPLESGPAQGGGAGQDRAGFANHGPISALLPSQWATPRALLRWRHANGGLLYRTRSGQEAPQLRPMVIVLDTSPACWGVIEALTRPVAHALALSLARQHRPAVLLTAGDNHVHYLDQPAERLQVLTHRSHQPVDIRAALAKAASLRAELGDGTVEPIVLLLTHCWS